MHSDKKKMPLHESQMMFDAVRLPAQIDHSIGVVIDYLWHDEWNAYHALPNRKRSGHIFEYLNALRVWRTFPVAKFEGDTRPKADDATQQVRRAVGALLIFWDELRNAEVLLKREISEEDMAMLAAQFDTVRDTRKLTAKDIESWLGASGVLEIEAD